MKVTNTTTLFTSALETMNRALEANADKIPYKQMLQAAEKIADGLTMGVAVYKDDPDTPFDYYTIRFVSGQFELVDHGKQDSDVTWKVSEQYLKDITDDPDRYIDNPAMLDWDWLKSRLGM